MGSNSDDVRIQSHAMLLEDPQKRAALLKQFIPVWFYRSTETNFPLNPDDYVKNVVEVKHSIYTKISESGVLSEKEQKELEFIKKYFWKNDAFNKNYCQDVLSMAEEDQQKFNELMQESPCHFLIFDEKHYGYALGEKIDITGVFPLGHEQYNKDQTEAPLFAVIIPTRNGFYIDYQYVYSLNNAIPGFQWLYKLLPEFISRSVRNFGLHYGDCEGVGIHVNYDKATGAATFASMQTYAHGRKGARLVNKTDCTIDEYSNETGTSVSAHVYVGEGGHPSYADHFIGRNTFLDRVGDAFTLRPQHVIDISPDRLQAKRENPYDEQYNDIPGAMVLFNHIADSNPISTHGPKNQRKLDRQKSTHNNYTPFLWGTTSFTALSAGLGLIIGGVIGVALVATGVLAPLGIGLLSYLAIAALVGAGGAVIGALTGFVVGLNVFTDKAKENNNNEQNCSPSQESILMDKDSVTELYGTTAASLDSSREPSEPFNGGSRGLFNPKSAQSEANGASEESAAQQQIGPKQSS